MSKYIIRRLLLLIPVILGVTILVFSIMYLVPGDPAVMMLGTEAEPAAVEALRAKLNLDKPYIVRLGLYMKQVFIDLDLGNSYITNVSITQELAGRIPNTLRLAIVSMLTSLCVGIPLGVYAATHHNRPGDYFTIVATLMGVSIPGFWLALMLVQIFSNELGWLPPYGTGGLEYWILPILSGALNGIANQARTTRSSMLEVINSDYIVMARSKGLSERRVIFEHALPNALIPVITSAGSSLGMSMGGGMLTETIFSIPGVGYYMVKAVNNRDYIAVQGSVLLLAIVFSLVMLLTDLALAAVDPRIKAQFAGSKRKKNNKKEDTANG